MAFRTICAIAPLGAMAVFTPQGERAAECVIQVPETAIVKPTNAGLALHHKDGKVEYHDTPASCHTDNVALRMAQNIPSNQWIDEAGFTYNAGFSKMTGYNNIPDAPVSEPRTVYYFLGMENMRGGPISILQPVLAYQDSEWTGASWACCPSNITTTGPTIGPAKEGDRMYGSMVRTDDSTWSIVTRINGQTSTLNAQVGPWAYTWAVATMEDYGVSSCSQLPHKPVTFDTIKLYDAQGSIVDPTWNPSGETMCSGRTTIVDENTVTIQHASAQHVVV